jgi:phosphoserine aminotransferase
MTTQNLETFSLKSKPVADGKLAYNFSAGPCILPRAVLDKCAEDMLNYRGSKQSVMELSHRKEDFIFISDQTKLEIRRFLNVPDNYRIMLNQGGATMQYTAVAKNLIGLKPKRKAMYFTTGLWSNFCITEARKFIKPENLIEVVNNSATNF